MSVLDFQPLITPATLGIYGAIAAVLIWWIRGVPERQRARTEADSSLRTALLARVTDLENRIAEMDRQREQDRREREEDRQECHREQEILRQRIREQDKLIDGLQRQIITFQIVTGRALPPEMRSPEIDKMIDELGIKLADGSLRAGRREWMEGEE